MARKKMRKFAGGGDFSASDEIVVKGKRAPVVDEMTGFDLARFGGMGGIGNAAGAGMAGMGGGGGGGSAPVAPRSNFSIGKVNTPAGSVYGPRYTNDKFSIGAGLGKGVVGMGGKNAPMFGASFRMPLAKGGKVDGEPTGGKKRTKAKKYAAGGSTASKRADGCATKGKTKGRFV